MANIIKKAFILTLFFTAFGLFVHAQTSNASDNDLPGDVFYNYIEDQKLSSSMYSRSDDMRLLDDEVYIEITDEDTLITSNQRFELYFNEETTNFKVKNLVSNYVWATALEDPDAGSYNGLLSSVVGIEYINKERNMALRQNVGLVDTQYTAGTHHINDGLRLEISIASHRQATLNVDFVLEVTLTKQGLKAHIPYDSIVEEETEKTVISSIIPFAALGASHKDDIPGYMVIPDGIGTMIRYEEKEGRFITPFEERYYGANPGLPTTRQSVTSYPLSMPIFGGVHGVDQNAFLGVIEAGDINARLLAYPTGSAFQPYNLIFPKFDLYQNYRQSFTSDGSGGATRVAKTLASDITLQYQFLDDSDANYTGIGRQYRKHLLATGVLNEHVEKQKNIPIHFQYLMSDSRRGFLGTSLVEMSTVDEVNAMYDAFMAQGIDNQRISLQGWNKGGYSGHLPSNLSYENSLGRKRDFEALIDHIQTDNDIYLLNNYINATEATSQITYRNDVAQGADRFQLERECPRCVYNRQYMLYPETTKRLSFNHHKDFEAAGVPLMFERLASTAFSYYDRNVYTRGDALDYYLEIMELYEGQAAYMYPNAYAYGFVSDFFHAPLFNSQLNYYDDLIPLLPIVLNGHMELYSQFLNFNSRGREQTLMLIDFGMNPAYILSHKPSSNLRNTDIEYLFSTHFEKWEESIIEEYFYINEALRHVSGETIEDRRVLTQGVVQTTYSNEVSIFVNYTSQEVSIDNVVIPPLDYIVRGAE